MERGGGGGQEQSGQFSLPKSCSSSKTQLISSPQCSSRDAPAPSPHLSFLSSLRSIPCASLVMSGFLSTYSVSDTIHVYFFFFIFLFRAVPLAYGGSQARGRIGATAAGLRHSHSNSDPSHVCDVHHSSRQCQIFNPRSEVRDQACILRRILVRFISPEPRWELRWVLLLSTF